MGKKQDKVKKRLLEFLSRIEGVQNDTYEDHKGVPTTGIGFNLKSPDMPGILTTLGINYNEVLNGDRQLTPDEISQVFDRVYDKRKGEFDKVRQNSFPGARLSEDQEAALLSMYYNSPQTIGPHIRQSLNDNDHETTAKEIMLNTNPDKSPGVMRRRIKEAEMFMGPDFEPFVNKNYQDIKGLRGIASKIDNPNVQKEIVDEHPFLSEDYEPPMEPLDFKKLFQLPKPMTVGDNNNE